MKMNQKGQHDHKGHANQTKSNNPTQRQNGQANVPAKQDKSRDKRNDERNMDEKSANNDPLKKKFGRSEDEDRNEDQDERDGSMKGRGRSEDMRNKSEDMDDEEDISSNNGKEQPDSGHPHTSQTPTAPGNGKRTDSNNKSDQRK